MAGVTNLKDENIRKVRACFYQSSELTKTRISQRTGISLAAVTNILQELLQSGEIITAGKASSTGGRRSKLYFLNTHYRHIGKIILRRFHEKYMFYVGSVALDDQIIYSAKIILDHGNTDELLSAIKNLLQQDPLIKLLLLSIPGVSKNGHISYCDFKDLENKDLEKMLTDEIGLPFIIENDVNTAAIGYHHVEKVKNMVFLYQPEKEYIGAGLIIENKLYNGADHKAGEIRFLPGYHLPERLLKERPEELLNEAIMSVSAILDPERIIYCSELAREKISLSFPYTAKIIQVKDLYDFIKKGLYAIAINQLLNMKEEN